MYAGGDNLASQAYVDQTATVLAFIGDAEAYLHDPDAPLATTAQIHADGDFTLNAESWTASNPEALTGPNAAFVADSAAYGSAVATKVTTTFIAGGAIVGAGGNADVTATSVESFTPLAAGSDGQGVNTNGTATTDVVLSRVTSVIVNGNASVDAQSITVAASSETHSSGSDILTDNQGQGAYNTTFHAGQGDSVSGKAASQSNFRIGLNTQSQSTPAATTVFIDGALTAPTIVVTARTLYDINVSSFAWVTAAAFGAQLSANTFMFTEDNVVVQFGDNASVDASSSLTLNAGFDPASVVSLYTKLHYSEDVQPLKSSTNAWTELDGLVALDNNDDQDAVTSPVIHASLDAALRPVVNWGFTVTDDNKRATYGPHDLTPNVSLDTRNDFASVASALEADPAAAVDASAVPNAPAAPAVNWGGAGNDWFVNPEATTAASGHRDGAIGSHQKEHRPSGKAYTTPFTAPRVNLPAGWGLRGSNAAQSAEAFQWAEPSGPAPRKIAADAAPKIFWTRN
ncbi:MAG: hypothetical protein KIT73_03235 [Burkholderiales bacterium]|nr:hypothetical protein [Burkholderiales bacterium]